MEKSVLTELVNGIVAIMESRLVSIVLYGSVAKGTNTEESDVDIVRHFKKWVRTLPFYQSVEREGIVLCDFSCSESSYRIGRI